MGRLPHGLSYGAPPTRAVRGAPLLSKKKRADGKGNVDKVMALSLKACKLIGGNQRNWDRNVAQGNLHWWRIVHNNILRKSHP